MSAEQDMSGAAEPRWHGAEKVYGSQPSVPGAQKIVNREPKPVYDEPGGCGAGRTSAGENTKSLKEKTSVEGNIKSLKEKIHAALKRSNRKNAVRIVAVTKGVEVPAIKQAIACGINSIGESKVLEAEEKKDLLEDDVAWHMVGHLQTNKARLAASVFDWVHSVDSLKIASKLNTACADLKKQMKVLVQVNIAGDKGKFGIRKEETKGLIEAINELRHLKLMGLMTIAPHTADPEGARPVFKELVRLKNLYSLPYISMGMTNDFGVAVEEGSNMVRIGRAIFGERGAMQTKDFSPGGAK